MDRTNGQRPNRIKAELSHGNVVCGCMVTEVRTPAIALILDTAGLDFFIIDMEHGSFTYETANDIIVATRGLSIVPFVRVPGIQREAFQKPLDAGALGLLVPQVESPEQVEQALDLMRYAPDGSRGLSLRRAHTGFTGPDRAQFTRNANNHIMLMIQIESKRAIENLDAICSVGGIDVLFVGPSDLAHSYGDSTPDTVARAIDDVIRMGHVHGISTGIHQSNLTHVSQLVDSGMRFISCNTDVGAIINTFAEARTTIKSSRRESI